VVSASALRSLSLFVAQPRKYNVVVDPILTVCKISNGFLLEAKREDGEGEMADVIYCRGAREIAEAIITIAAKERLGVPQAVAPPPAKQGELLTPAQMGPQSKDQRGKLA